MEYNPKTVNEVAGESSKTIFVFFTDIEFQNKKKKEFIEKQESEEKGYIHIIKDTDEYWRLYYPHDIDDFSRNYRLLQVQPQWRQRIKEIGILGREWKNLAEHWDEIEQCYLEEKDLFSDEKCRSEIFRNGKTTHLIKKCRK